MFFLVQVLLDGYLMVAIDGPSSDSTSGWFCYHASAHSILPINFCKKNNIPLTVPSGKNKTNKNKTRKKTIKNTCFCDRLRPSHLHLGRIPEGDPGQGGAAEAPQHCRTGRSSPLRF